MNRSTFFAASVLASITIALAGTTARAQLGGASGIVIPYAGKLELNGALVTGSVDFRFDVLENGTTTTACFTVGENPALPVTVTNGEFSVTIPAVPESCVKGKDVHLRIAVRQGTDTFVVLGEQRVTPVVGAVTSGPGDFAVTGSLTASSAAVGGAVTAKSLVVSDNNLVVAEFKNSVTGLSIGSDTIKATGSVTNQDIVLVPKGATGLVEVAGPLLVDQRADISGDLNVDGTLRKSGAPMFLVCTHTESVNFGAGSHVILMSPNDCGGTTPDSTYVAMASTLVICNGQASVSGWDVSGTTVGWLQTGTCTNSQTTVLRFVYMKK